MHYKVRYPPDGKTAKPSQKPVKMAARPKPRSSPPRPFDPEELRRKLYVVLTEQRVHAEKKRRAKLQAEQKAKQTTDEDESTRGNTTHLEEVSPSKAPKDPPRVRSSKTKTTGASDSEATDKEKLHRTISKTSTESSSHGKEEDPTGTYHHVPQVAASQFARTTTVESLTDRKMVHKLSRKAMKFHMEGPNASREVSGAVDAAPCEQAKALRRAQSLRERQYERNQFQHTPTLATTAEVDEKHARRAHRHTMQPHNFEEIFRGNEADQRRMRDPRRMSTGSMLGKPDDVRGSAEVAVDDHDRCDICALARVNSCEHRVDWTQSDEVPTQLNKTMSSPLRKPESKWTLRGRLGSFNKYGREEKPSSPPDDKAAFGESPKSPKSGFFARFKR